MGVGLSFFLGIFSNFLSSILSNFPDLVAEKKLPLPVRKMVSLSSTSRHRQFQRYEGGCRQVVGCIPYRYRNTNEQPSINENNIIEDLEVLVISAQNGHGMLFPKGGWEIHESKEDAALRETREEAGVSGKLEDLLGVWIYKSKRGTIMHEGYMFPLLVEDQLDLWEEKSIRNRQWVSIDEAKEVLPYRWMRESLDELVRRQLNLRQHMQQHREEETTMENQM